MNRMNSDICCDSYFTPTILLSSVQHPRDDVAINVSSSTFPHRPTVSILLSL